MKILYIFLSCFILISLKANEIKISENTGKNLFEYEVISNHKIKVDFNLLAYKTEIIHEAKTEFLKIHSEGQGDRIDVGMPDLPRFTTFLIIPDQGEVSWDLRSSNSTKLSDIIVYPRQELKIENIRKDYSFTINDSYYQTGNEYPSQIIEIGDPVIFRDFRLISVSINPFLFKAKEQSLKIYTQLNLEISISSRSGKNTKVKSSKKSLTFEPIYQSLILNYNDINLREDFQKPSYLYIYPDNNTVETYLQGLIKWRHMIGFEVVAASTSETGSNLNSIKSYIQNAYNNWENPPEFVCLVGDAGGSYNIPTGHMPQNGYSGEGDHFYTLLEGNDFLSDIVIGRLSFNNIYELQTIISKIMNYEKEPYLGNTEWYNKAVMIGDPTSSGPSVIDTKMHVKQMIDYYQPNIYSTEVYSGQWVSQMSNNLNNGVSYFNYRGFGGMSGWTTYNINNLTNGFMLPVAIALTCCTGDFEGTYDCISEGFLKAGSANNPKGAIAAISTATGNTHTCFNNCMDSGINYGIFVDKIYNMGGALLRGKLNLYQNYPDNPYDYVTKFSYWNNLMGDPGMALWTSVPQPLIVTYPEEIGIGTNYLEVTVTDHNGFPLEGAWVTALMTDNIFYEDDLFATTYTDNQGKAILEVFYEENGEVDLTVTKHDFIPHLGSFQINQADVALSIDDYQVDDDNNGTSNGNGDGLINPGETIELAVNLKNHGTTASGNISAFLSCDSPYVNITDGNENYDSIGAGESAYSADDFDFVLADNALGGTEIRLDFEFSNGSREQWTDHIYFTVMGAYLEAEDYTVIDGGNQILDPGETAELVITIENLGQTVAAGVYGTLSCDDSRIEIGDDSGYFGPVSPGGNASCNGDAFQVTANTQIIPGSQYTMELQLYNDDGYDNTVTFLLEVGTVTVNDPLGPDAYGYYCYDDGDDYYDPAHIAYNWVEIDPNLGGPGTVIPMYDYGEDNGDKYDLDLPFTFKYYGVDYNDITVCSNGWLAPGTTEQDSSPQNWSVPGPGGPSPMIAPFWDDLNIPSTGHVCYFYDTALHALIVEWSQLKNEYNNSTIETFQVLLYDPNFYPTSTGDSEFKFQYKEFNNVDVGDYNGWHVQHGQYCTVGIEDHTGNVGLQYSFNNQYPTAARTLTDEMALLFTGPPIAPEEPYLVMGGIEINDENGNDNGNADYAENIDVSITLNNMGENAATDVIATIIAEDPFITINNATSTYNDIIGGSSGTNLVPFNIDVSPVCPDGHVVPFTVEVESNEEYWELYFNMVLFAPEINVGFVTIVNDDDNNGILDPGENADILVPLLNSGGAAAYNINAILSSEDEFITINNNSDDLDILEPGFTNTVTYNISVSEEVELGHNILFDLVLNADYNYTTTTDFSLTVGLCIEDFESGNFEAFPWEFSGSADWTISGNAYQGNYCAKSGPISDSQSTSLKTNLYVLNQSEISFWVKTSCQSGGDFVAFYIDNNFKEDWSGSTSWQQYTTYVTPGEHTFEWKYEKDWWTSSGSDCAWVDFIIFPANGLGAYGNITGHVTLEQPGNYEDILITAGEYNTNADSDGNYMLSVPYGEYEVSASLQGFETITYEGIFIPPYDTIIRDFTLPFIAPPANLDAVLSGNTVNLSWDSPQLVIQNNEQEKRLDNRESRVLQYYKVYRNINNGAFNFLFATTQTVYEDDLTSEDYFGYYVTAIYSNNSESDPSNTVYVDFTPTNENDLVFVNNLAGNYPNPFNPETNISFSLAESGKVALEIYNLKGELIISLINDYLEAGNHQILWQGFDKQGKAVPSGIYLYRMVTKDYRLSKKMILMK